MAKVDGNGVFVKARRHLARRDPVMKRLIAQVGGCTLQFNADRFGVLVRSIVSQQISGKAARSISARLEETLGESGICAAALLAASDEALSAAGLSAAKARAVRDLAEKVHGGTVPLDVLHALGLDRQETMFAVLHLTLALATKHHTGAKTSDSRYTVHLYGSQTPTLLIG